MKDDDGENVMSAVDYFAPGERVLVSGLGTAIVKSVVITVTEHGPSTKYSVRSDQKAEYFDGYDRHYDTDRWVVDGRKVSRLEVTP